MTITSLKRLIRAVSQELLREGKCGAEKTTSKLSEEAWWTAVRMRDLGSVEKFLKAGFSPNTKSHHPLYEGDTALHMFASQGNTEGVRLLLKNGACPNIPDCDGDTPAHIAALYGAREAYGVLERYKGTKTGVKNAEGKTAHEILEQVAPPRAFIGRRFPIPEFINRYLNP